MKGLRIVRMLLLSFMLFSLPAAGMAQPPKPPEGFVPVDQLPNQEQLPATPLVATAYGVAWVAVLLYLFSIWRRLAAVERELADVARRIDAQGRR
jgi:CcmD family protein